MLPEMEKFNAKFEDIYIHVHSLDIEQIHEIHPEIFALSTPYSAIWHNMSVNGIPQSKDLVGKIFIVFRDQNDYKMALFLEGQIVVKADADSKSANTFCKLTQYLFNWVENYVKDNKIKNANGDVFLVPHFLYSSSHFQGAFPE